MKRLLIYALTCLFATLMGCDKSDEVMNNLPEASDKQVTVTANIQGDAATRVTLTPDTDEELHPIVKVAWKESSETFTAYADGDGEPILFTQTADTPISFGGENGSLRLRGKSSIGTADDSSFYSQISFGNAEVEVACTGDIRTLVDWENYDAADTSGARFCNLFQGCTELVTAPKLPATTLAESCYYQMFYGCTSLTAAPELPATTLAESCYYRMFYGCKLLNSITMLATDISAEDCLESWVSNVAKSGTFTKAAGVEIKTGTSGIPKNWTVVDYTAPVE